CWATISSAGASSRKRCSSAAWAAISSSVGGPPGLGRGADGSAGGGSEPPRDRSTGTSPPGVHSDDTGISFLATGVACAAQVGPLILAHLPRRRHDPVHWCHN